MVFTGRVFAFRDTFKNILDPEQNEERIVFTTVCFSMSAINTFQKACALRRSLHALLSGGFAGFLEREKRSRKTFTKLRKPDGEIVNTRI